LESVRGELVAEIERLINETLPALEARLNSSSGVGVEVGELRRKLEGFRAEVGHAYAVAGVVGAVGVIMSYALALYFGCGGFVFGRRWWR